MAAVTVIGTGYVGLTTAAGFAHLGHRVTGVDVDAAKVSRLAAGEVPILEKELDPLVEEGLSSGRLSFTTDVEQAAAMAEFAFLCVPTPQGADGSADLTQVLAVACQIGPHLPAEAVVVTKSTVPVGSAWAVAEALARPDVSVVSNPEFLREGTAVTDWMHPNRVVVGSEDRRAAERVAALYEPLGAPVVVTDPASAETIKYACNAFLAAKVSFVNAIANLCLAVGAEVADVLVGMSYDKRIGTDHLMPGPGWGGSCLPKDTAALIRMAADHGYRFRLLEEVVAANEAQLDLVAARVLAAANPPAPTTGAPPASGAGQAPGTSGAGEPPAPRVAAWGLTFKSGTDDLRESPALAVLRRLQRSGAQLRAYDPSLPDPAHPALSGLSVDLCDDPYEACSDADVLVVLTEWPQFAGLDFGKVAGLMARPVVVDGRNLLDPDTVAAAGLHYEGMGRRPRSPHSL